MARIVGAIRLIIERMLVLGFVFALFSNAQSGQPETTSRHHHHRHRHGVSAPSKRAIHSTPNSKHHNFGGGGGGANSIESSPSVNQIPLDDAISSNFNQIQGELASDRQFTIVLSPSSQTKRFYFQTIEPQQNFSLTITPCENSLRYQLLFVNANSIKNLRKRKVRRRSRKYYVKLLNRRLQQQNTRLLFNQTINDRFTFTEEILEYGLYILQVSSLDSQETSAQVYLASNGRSPYPRLPPVASVLTKQIKAKNDSAVEVWWNPVVPERHEPSFVYEYCVAINEYLRPRSQCLHQSKPGNETTNIITEYHSPDYLVQEFEKEFGNFLSKNPVKSDQHYACGKDTARRFFGITPEVLYRVDVFVRNQVTGFTSRYWTSNFTLSKPKIEPQVAPPTLMYDSLFTGVFLEHQIKFSKKFTYKLPANELSDRLYVFVQPCDGVGPVQLIVRRRESLDTQQVQEDSDVHVLDYEEYEDYDTSVEKKAEDDVLLAEEVSETKTFEVIIPRQRYVYEIELNTEDIKQSRSLIVLVSSDLSRFPFPRMPNDRTIRSLYSMRKCDSVTLAWDASPDEKVLYCIYQRDADYRYSNFEESKDLCQRITPATTKPPVKRRALSHGENENSLEQFEDDEEEEKKYTPTRKVVCRRFKSSKRRQHNMIIQNVLRLQPGKRYVFQIVITKNGGRKLTYEQVWTETKPESQCFT